MREDKQEGMRWKIRRISRREMRRKIGRRGGRTITRA